MIVHTVLTNLLVAMTLLLFFAFPEVFAGSYRKIIEGWTLYKSKRLNARKRRTREKLLRYREVDIRDLR